MRRQPPLVLVFPPQPYLLDGFASGIVSLASYIGRHLPDCELLVLDLARETEATLLKRLRSELNKLDGSPIIGISATTASYPSALMVAEAGKILDSSCTVVLGGPHTRAQDELILRRHVGVVDYVIPGEGEVPLTHLMAAFPDVNAVPGLSRLECGEFVPNEPPPMLTTRELDLIDIDLRIPIGSAVPGKFEHATYVSARGCPLPCAFCAVGGEAIRAKSVERVTADIRHMVRDLGYTSIAIEDNFFAHAPSRTQALCDALARLRTTEKLEFSWDCQTRVESLARGGTIEAMAHAGCEAVYLGVEALDPRTLIYLSKTRTPDRYLKQLEEDVVPSLLSSSVNCYINLQLGVPGEDAESRREALRSLRRIGRLAAARGKKVTVFPQLHVVYPGTRHFHMGVQAGMFPPDIFESFTRWEYDNKPIRRLLGHIFAHGTGGLCQGILQAEPLSAGDPRISERAKDEVVSQLMEMDTIDGVQVFKYGRFIVNLERCKPSPGELPLSEEGNAISGANGRFHQLHATSGAQS